MLRRLVGATLLLLASVLAVVWWTPVVDAESTQGMTVTGTVSAQTGMTLDATSVALPAGAPGSAVTSTSQTCVTIATNTGQTWALAFRAGTANFTSSGGGSFPTTQLRWRIVGQQNFTAVSSTGNVATDQVGKDVCLDFQLVYPADAPAGDYSASFNMILS